MPSLQSPSFGLPVTFVQAIRSQLSSNRRVCSSICRGPLKYRHCLQDQRYRMDNYGKSLQFFCSPVNLSPCYLLSFRSYLSLGSIILPHSLVAQIATVHSYDLTIQLFLSTRFCRFMRLPIRSMRGTGLSEPCLDRCLAAWLAVSHLRLVRTCLYRPSHRSSSRLGKCLARSN